MLLRTLTRALAMAALLILLGVTPKRAALERDLRAAQQAMQGMRPAQALDILEDILLFEPALQQAHALSARAAISLGDPFRAALHLSSLHDLSLIPDIACLRAEVALLNKQPTTALEELEGICDREADLLKRISLEFESQGKISAALTTLLRLSKDAGDVDRRIAILTSTQDPEAAHALLVAESSLDDPLLHELAFAIETSRIVEAPSFSLAQVGQTLARAGDWRLAAEAFQNATQIDPSYAEARAYLGLALDQIGQDGLDELQAAAAMTDSSALPHLFLGRHWRSKGAFAPAMRSFEKAVELEPDDPGVMVELAATYRAAGQIPEAKDAYLRAVALAPQNPLFWGLLADFAIDQEIEVESLGLDAARVGLRLSPTDPLMHDRIASSYFMLGNLRLAERFLSQALMLAPGNPVLQYHLGLLRHAQGDQERAVAALEMAISLDPSGSVAELARRSLARILP